MEADKVIPSGPTQRTEAVGDAIELRPREKELVFATMRSHGERRMLYSTWVRKINERGVSQNRLLVLCPNRIFSFKVSKWGKRMTLQRVSHYLELRRIEVAATKQELNLVFDEFNLKFASKDFKLILEHLADAFVRLLPNWPDSSLPFRLDGMPQNRFARKDRRKTAYLRRTPETNFRAFWFSFRSWHSYFVTHGIQGYSSGGTQVPPASLSHSSRSHTISSSSDPSLLPLVQLNSPTSNIRFKIEGESELKPYFLAKFTSKDHKLHNPPCHSIREFQTLCKSLMYNEWFTSLSFDAFSFLDSSSPTISSAEAALFELLGNNKFIKHLHLNNFIPSSTFFSSWKSASFAFPARLLTFDFSGTQWLLEESATTAGTTPPPRKQSLRKRQCRRVDEFNEIFKRKNFFKTLKRLNLMDCGLHAHAILALGDLLKYCPGLRTLSLSYNPIGLGVLAEPSLSTPARIEESKQKDSSPNKKPTISERLVSALEPLWISGSEASKEEKSLKRQMSTKANFHAPRIQELELSFCANFPVGLLFQSFLRCNECPLKFLDLSGNVITPESAGLLCSWLASPSVHSLETLNLAVTELSPSDLLQVLQTCAQNVILSPIFNLDVSQNIVGYAAEAENIARGVLEFGATEELQPNEVPKKKKKDLDDEVDVNRNDDPIPPKYRSIVLNEVELGDEGLQKFFNVLCTERPASGKPFKLHLLSVSSNVVDLASSAKMDSAETQAQKRQIRQDTCKALSQFFAANLSIHSLHISGSGSTEESDPSGEEPVLPLRFGPLMSLAFEGLKSNNNLIRLDVTSNAIGDQGVSSLCDVLTINSTLTTLFWDDNQVGFAGFRSMEKCMKTNRALCKLVFPQRDVNRLKQRVQGKSDDGEEQLKKIFREINRFVVRNLKLVGKKPKKVEPVEEEKQIVGPDDEGPRYCVFGRQCKKLMDPAHNKRYLHASVDPRKLQRSKAPEEQKEEKVQEEQKEGEETPNESEGKTELRRSMAGVVQVEVSEGESYVVGKIECAFEPPIVEAKVEEQEDGKAGGEVAAEIVESREDIKEKEAEVAAEIGGSREDIKEKEAEVVAEIGGGRNEKKEKEAEAVAEAVEGRKEGEGEEEEVEEAGKSKQEALVQPNSEEDEERKRQMEAVEWVRKRRSEREQGMRTSIALRMMGTITVEEEPVPDGGRRAEYLIMEDEEQVTRVEEEEREGVMEEEEEKGEVDGGREGESASSSSMEGLLNEIREERRKLKRERELARIERKRLEEVLKAAAAVFVGQNQVQNDGDQKT